MRKAGQIRSKVVGPGSYLGDGIPIVGKVVPGIRLYCTRMT